jgi:hypothetical protein
MRIAPALHSALALLLLSGCEPATQPGPPIPLTESPNDFFAVLSGARTGIYSGSAVHGPADAGTGRKVRLLSAPGDSVTIVLQPGVLGSGSHAFPLGKQGIDRFVGVHPLDATITFLVDGHAFYAISGSVEVVQSSATVIRGRFDFTCVSLDAPGSVRVQGTFWSVPDPAP